MEGHPPGSSKSGADMAPSDPPAYSAPSASHAPPPAMNAPAELPPSYSKLDEHPTHFTINGTIISIPSGPFYQLSSSLDQPYYTISMRRLTSREIAQMKADPKLVAYDKSRTLYTYTQDLTRRHLGGSSIDIRGQRGSALPGNIHFKRTKFVHEDRDKEFEIFHIKSSKRSLFSSKPAPIEYVDSRGVIVGTEILDNDGQPTTSPQLVLPHALEPMVRDALVACWIGRIWSHAVRGDDLNTGASAKFKANREFTDGRGTFDPMSITFKR